MLLMLHAVSAQSLQPSPYSNETTTTRKMMNRLMLVPTTGGTRTPTSELPRNLSALLVSLRPATPAEGGEFQQNPLLHSYTISWHMFFLVETQPEIHLTNKNPSHLQAWKQSNPVLLPTPKAKLIN